MKIQKRNQIGIKDWNDLITSTYNKIYNFQQQEGCKDRGIETIIVPVKDFEDFENIELPFELNGEEMGVSFQVWLNTSPEETKKHFSKDYENDLFWDRNFYPHIDMIINDLHSKGLLKEGEYDIKIDW